MKCLCSGCGEKREVGPDWVRSRQAASVELEADDSGSHAALRVQRFLCPDCFRDGLATGTIQRHDWRLMNLPTGEREAASGLRLRPR